MKIIIDRNKIKVNFLGNLIFSALCKTNNEKIIFNANVSQIDIGLYRLTKTIKKENILFFILQLKILKNIRAIKTKLASETQIVIFCQF